MAVKTLRVRAVEGHRVSRGEAFPRLEYIGHKCVDHKADTWVRTDDVIELPGPGASRFGTDYVRSVRAGDLAAADAETAAFCGVQWTPAPAPARVKPADKD